MLHKPCINIVMLLTQVILRNIINSIYFNRRKEEKQEMKKLIALVLAITVLMSFCACGEKENKEINNSNEEVAETTEVNKGETVPVEEISPITVKGTFLLEPSENMDMSKEGLEAVQRYFLVVFDMESGESNQELYMNEESLRATFNGINIYKQLTQYDFEFESVLKSFLPNCGYTHSDGSLTIWSGEAPTRMVSIFTINKNDMKEDCTVQLQFDFSDSVKSTVELTKNDIKTINWLDGIFAVEDDPDAYQVAHSVKNRAEQCKYQIETASQENHNGDASLVSVRWNTCAGLLYEGEELGGVSCGGVPYLTKELPSFNLESVRLYYPEIAEKLQTVKDSVQIMIDEWAKEEPDYDNLNTAQRTAYDTLNEILDYFDAS